jgi:hypothetical protein
MTYSNEYVNDVSDPQNTNFVGGKYKIRYMNGSESASATPSPTPTTTMPPNYNYIYINMPNQKWNYIVINMNNGVMDVFINGNLAKTVSIQLIPSFSPLDTVVIGDNPGVDGAICNVKYYTVPMTKYEITNSYNLLMYKNPPVQ